MEPWTCQLSVVVADKMDVRFRAPSPPNRGYDVVRGAKVCCLAGTTVRSQLGVQNMRDVVEASSRHSDDYRLAQPKKNPAARSALNPHVQLKFVSRRSLAEAASLFSDGRDGRCKIPQCIHCMILTGKTGGA